MGQISKMHYKFAASYGILLISVKANEDRTIGWTLT